MKQITIKDVRRAITYVGMSGEHVDILRDVSDEQLLASDFTKDFKMGNIRVVNVLVELERIYNLCVPVEVFKTMTDNTVGTFMNAVNKYLSEKPAS